MSTTTETLPPLARRSDAAYLDFVEGLREFILGKGADFEERLNSALEQRSSNRGRPWGDVEEIREFVHASPLGRLRDRLARSQQEMKWHAIERSFDEQRAQLTAELSKWDERGPGRLLLDPAFEHPT